MSKNINKEDRNIIILIIIFLLLLGIYFINVLLNNSEDLEGNIEVDNGDYKLISQTDRFKLYTIKDNLLNNFNTYIDDINIKYSNNELIINDNSIITNIDLIKYISIYNDNLMLYCKNKDTYSDNIIIYNKYTNEFKVISEINDMYIIDIDNIDIFEAGVNIRISNIVNNKLYYKGNTYDICEYKDDIVVLKNIVYYYDFDSENFYSVEVLSTTKLNEYKKDIC